MLSPELQKILKSTVDKKGKIVFLTGAGISAESGIPTFRGEEGYWVIGSENYYPEEMATYEMFTKNPEEVWKWYLYRYFVCNKSFPNPGHEALVKMENLFGDRFHLITQNVDGLHLRAGNSLKRMYLIHGSLQYVRCSKECTDTLYPFPEGISEKGKNDQLNDSERALLKCPKCNSLLRPHVLWFDEYYNEEFYKISSSLKIAEESDILFVIGTAGATNLPNQIVNRVVGKGGYIVEINIADNDFSRIIKNHSNGIIIRKPSGEVLPEIFEFFESLYKK